MGVLASVDAARMSGVEEKLLGVALAQSASARSAVGSAAGLSAVGTGVVVLAAQLCFWACLGSDEPPGLCGAGNGPGGTRPAPPSPGRVEGWRGQRTA